MAAEMLQPALPQTPTSNRQRRSNIQYRTTPNSRTDGIRTGTSTRRTTWRSPNNVTPTPQRHRNVGIAPNGEDADLFAEVIALLQSENIKLKCPAELKLRHVIRMREELYEAQIRAYTVTVRELSEKLAEEEGGRS
jgi:hypothetical protein